MKSKRTKKREKTIEISVRVFHHFAHNDEVERTAVAEPGLTEALKKGMEKTAGAKSASTLMNYLTAQRSVANYIGENRGGDRIDAALFTSYERWLQGKGVSLNTVSCYLRSIRSLLMQSGAVSQQTVERAFKPVFTGKAKTEKRSVPIESLALLRNLGLEPGHPLSLARDVFLFSFYAQGMPFVDVAHLRRAQWSGGHIVYHRHKTGQRISITVEPCIEEILQRYADDSREYLFPILTATDPSVAQHQYLTRLGQYNRYLKTLATMAGIPQKLTSYVVRHSWASAAYRSNVDLPVIQKALGHTNPQTTMVYIREIDDERLAEANRYILAQFQCSQ